jgi:hypothetical protein
VVKLREKLDSSATIVTNLPSILLLQPRRPAAAPSRKFLHDLTTARHFKKFFFVICIIRIFTMKTEKFQLRGNNSVYAGAFQLLRGCAPAQLRGNVERDYTTGQTAEAPWLGSQQS